ncbi:MAG: hypothetical protein IPM63_15455 [Acidobacteriota bacterium]|nr:MAG: hypothetical protein IPM63_15455 [Acidobacteriota bacterium]
MSAEEEKSEQEVPEEETNDLREPLWAVIAFDGPIAKGLTYDEAIGKIGEFSEDEKPGLCVVTNEVAERMKKT